MSACASFKDFFFFKQKTAYEIPKRDWSSDVCSSDLIGADHHSHVGGRHFRINLLHFVERRIGHVGFSQKHVHVSGHASGHGMNGVFQGDAAFFQDIAKLAAGVLRLGGGHAVSGNKDHLAGIGELDSNVIEPNFAHGTGDRGFRGDGSAKAAKQHIGDGAVHGAAHENREDESGKTVESAGDDENVVAQHKASRGRGESGIRIQQRHHHGHIGGADRNDQHDAENKSAAHHGIEKHLSGGVDDPRNEAADHYDKERQVKNLLAFKHDWRAAHQLLQLGCGNQRTGNRQRAKLQ